MTEAIAAMEISTTRYKFYMDLYKEYLFLPRENEERNFLCKQYNIPQNYLDTRVNPVRTHPKWQRLSS